MQSISHNRRWAISILFAGLLCAPFTASAKADHVLTSLLFFNRGSASIVPAGMAVVKEAKQTGASSRGSFTIVGFCDTSEAHPESLSLARAKAVAALLVKFGVPARAIVSVRGLGTSNPMVPTGPNVPEPQNRRVIIFIAN